jgi:hypothetical protein
MSLVGSRPLSFRDYQTFDRSGGAIPAMKTIFKNLVQRTAKNPIAYLFYSACGRGSHYLGRIYKYAKSVRQGSFGTSEQIKAQLSPDLTVANGPFKGLRYAAVRSSGSQLLPKLLGSYESELHPVLEELLRNRYNTIVDIGCAEGYYAIGLALRSSHAEVYAFDTNASARKLCAEMSRLNSVSCRVHIEKSCNEEALRSIPLGDRALIICDCEGYEGSMFNRRVAEFLVKHDVIIETHDFIDIELSIKMRDAFAKTHRIRSFKSVDDIEKAHTYHYSGLEHLSTIDRHLILREGRPAIMEWLVMTSKEKTSTQLQVDDRTAKV